MSKRDDSVSVIVSGVYVLMLVFCKGQFTRVGRNFDKIVLFFFLRVRVPDIAAAAPNRIPNCNNPTPTPCINPSRVKSASIASKIG